ncbi:MAG: hypothetical protein KGJ09_09170 [Candidatus Omnitrophica bacterium]|nr:hypothetical protein [Candidatus Omnitrophota bacterium]
MYDFIRNWLEANKTCTSFLAGEVRQLLAERDRMADELERIKMTQTVESGDALQDVLKNLDQAEREKIEGELAKIPSMKFISVPPLDHMVSDDPTTS